jgi:uncharacterized protein YlxW (UPF0749 family)
MHRTTQTSLGTFAIIPFLFILMGLAGFFFVTNLAIVVADQDEAEAAKRSVQQQEQELRAIEEAYQRLQDRLAMLQGHLNSLSAAKYGQETLAALRQELQHLQTALAKAQTEHGQLRHQRATLADKLTVLEKLEKKVATMRLSETDIAGQVRQLRDEIAALTAQIGTVQREIEAKEQVQAQQLVPAGSRKPAVFVECTADGVLLMPERTLLQAAVPPTARETFLARVTAKGYAVFLIRPDGLTAFKRYREVLETYNNTARSKVDMGYEPVNADWKLVYPNN